jgi:soluble lytic murein transglycosylase
LLASFALIAVAATAPGPAPAPATDAEAASAPAWRYSAEPTSALESELRGVAGRDGDGALAAIVAAADHGRDTATGGLAHLLAGLRLLEGGRNAEALAHLSHPDVALTSLRDRALFAAGQAQEALGRPEEAARLYLAAAAEPASAVVCDALPRAATLLVAAHQLDAAVDALGRAEAACPDETPDVLLALGDAELQRGDRPAAAAVFDRLEREYPTASEGRSARARLAALADVRPSRTPAERAHDELQRGSALLSAGRSADALAALRAVSLPALPPEEADLARVRLARALLARRRPREALAILQSVPADSPSAPEAAFLLARERAKRTRSPEAYEAVAAKHRATEWGEEALLALANHYQKDALYDAALPWWRCLAAEYPEGRYVERAALHVGAADFRAGRYQQAAAMFEGTARLRPPGSATPGLLYWAGRSRLALADVEGARRLLDETVTRYRNTYHGIRAREALARLGSAPAEKPALLAEPGTAPELPEPQASRLRELLLIDRLDEAKDELRLVPQTPRVLATLAWIDWRRGRYRAAIVTMKRAFPEWIGDPGDRLPGEVWRILFPLRFDDKLRAAAANEGLDAALVAAVILQESTFDPAALSRAGARGLMQVMPATGRRIARAKGQRFRRAALHDPKTSLDFGTHYLRQMSERYDGAVEKVLAAYNAGPDRVDEWVAAWHGPRSAEEFIEDIPFTETRGYVMVVLANREQYRRLYGLGRPAPGPVIEGPRP